MDEIEQPRMDAGRKHRRIRKPVKIEDDYLFRSQLQEFPDRP